MTDPKRIEDLLAVAKAATPGPWGQRFWIGPLEWHDGTKATIFAHGPVHEYKETNTEAFADMAFIAQFNPAFVTRLLESWAELRTALETVNEEFETLIRDTVRLAHPAAEVDISESVARQALKRADEVLK